MPATRWRRSTSIPAPRSSPTCRTRSTKSNTSPAAPIPNGAPSASKTATPRPFPLHYIEIGNEDQFDRSASYDGRFAQFYNAIKQRYPDLQIIATTPVKSVTPDVLDEHFYMSAAAIVLRRASLRRRRPQRAQRSSSASGPRARATPRRTSKPRWPTPPGSPASSATATSSSWPATRRSSSTSIPAACSGHTDLIGYDALTSYGSPSYWTQVMFSTHLGTEVVPAALANAPAARLRLRHARRATHKLFVKVVNATSTAQPLAIDLAGVKKLAPQATLTTMSGKTPNATNSITHPDAVVPVTRTVPVAGPKFTADFRALFGQCAGVELLVRSASLDVESVHDVPRASHRFQSPLHLI